MGFLALGVMGVRGLDWVYLVRWIAQNLPLNRIDTTALLFCT
jgi:hypothetical protein